MNIQSKNATMALKLGLIDWFQYFAIIKTLPIILVAMAITACGGSGGGGESAPTAPTNPQPVYSCAFYQGHYSNDLYAGQTMDADANCGFTDSICGYSASFTLPDVNTGATVITVNGTNGTPGCMSSTAHSCTVAVQGQQLFISCDAGAHNYSFTGPL